ncbi:MAG: YbhN family protein [Anaerolineales bacterium]
MMPNHKHPATSPIKRLWRYLPILILLGLAVRLLLPQITTLESSWSVLLGMTWWAVALAAAAQVLSYAGSGFTMHAILDANQQKLSPLKGALITMASASIGLLVGGWVGGTAATYRWVRREGHDGNTATLAGTLPAILNNVVLAGVAVIGTAYLLLVHDLSPLQLIGFGVVLFVLVLMIFGIVNVLRFPETATRFAVGLAGRWAGVRHKPYQAERTVASVTEFIKSWDSLREGKWLRPVLGAVANTGFDILTLYFLFIAARQDVNLGILFAGYGLPFILGKMAFLFPGGIGVMETSMVALYDSLSVPNEVSVVVILGYRLFSFWLPTLLGFAAALYLSRGSSRGEVEAV